MAFCDLSFASSQRLRADGSKCFHCRPASLPAGLGMLLVLGWLLRLRTANFAVSRDVVRVLLACTRMAVAFAHSWLRFLM